MDKYRTDNRIVLLVKLSKFSAAIEATKECYRDLTQHKLFWTAPRGAGEESLLDRVLEGHIDEVYDFITSKRV
jgi:hypothetical protein